MSVIDEVLELVHPADADTLTIEQIRELRSEVSIKQQELLGFENDAKEALLSYGKALDRKIVVIENGGEHYRPFATLDMLKWRDQDGNPRLVLFSITDPRWRITAYSNGSTNITPWLGDKLRSYYQDVLDRLVAMARDKRGFRAFWKDEMAVTLSCRYTGVIPDSTRQKIKHALNNHLFDEIFIMAEGKNFSLKEESVPRVIMDPLVVGWDKRNLWLIDRFDLTPVEQLIASEFTL